jgi:signal transduction histidine kinase
LSGSRIERLIDGLRSRWRARTLRFQFAAVVALVGLLLITVNAALLGVLLNNYVLDRDGTALGQEAATLSRCSSNGILAELIARRPPGAVLLQALLGSMQDHHAIVVDSSGQLRYATPMAPELRNALLTQVRRDLALRQLAFSGTPPWLVVGDELAADAGFTCSASSAPVAPSVALRGAVLLAEDRQVAASTWHQLVGDIVVAGLVATAVAALAGLLAGEAMTRSIHAVTRVARAIAAGDLRRRVSPRGPAEIDEMAVAFNRMVEEVVRQRRIERDLLANISHELGSPLSLIRGYAEALADDIIQSRPERRTALLAIQQETVRLQRLTADLLDLALLETGQVSVVVEDVPVDELLAGLRERLAPMMQRAGVALCVETPISLPPLRTDGQRLEQVLVNLLGNAMRYTPSGGRIVMSAGQEGDNVKITLADSGAGIPADELPRIWERFYRVEKGRDRQGDDTHVGLGLAICRSTVLLLHGRIEVESAPGVGTTFSIWLPLGTDDERVPLPA